MQRIGFDEFLAHLLAYDRAVPGEVLTENYLRFSDDYRSDKTKNEFFFSRSCCVNKSVFGDDCFVFIHQVSDECDIEYVSSQVKNLCKTESAKNPDLSISVFALLGKEFVDKYRDSVGTLHYSRMGETFEQSGCERLIDASEFCETAKKYIHNDTMHGRMLAETFAEYETDDVHKLVACRRDGKIVGAASYAYFAEADIAHLCNIYVIPEYRASGCAHSLVQFAIADYPNVKWVYQCAPNNEPSKLLASSLGFTLAGATIMLDIQTP